MEFYLFFTAENRLQLLVQIDEASVVRVLQSILLDVLPEGGHDACSGLFFET